MSINYPIIGVALKQKNQTKKWDLGQIDGGEFKFLGPEIKFERNERNRILRIKNEKLATKSKIGHGYACSNPQSGRLLDF